MSAMMNVKERAAQMERLAHRPTDRELERVNGIFRAFLFRRSRTREVWTTCCRRHEFIKDNTDNACELRILAAPHTPEARSVYDNSPEHKRRKRCPYCGAEVTVKELRYTGGRKNLWSYGRAVLLRQWRGALWATAWDCVKDYSCEDMSGDPILTAPPKMHLLGVYRFAPGVAEQASRPWWAGCAPMNYISQREVGKSGGRRGAMWKIHAPFGCCSEWGRSYRIIGEEELEKSFLRWCKLGQVQSPAEDFIELLTAACFYPRQIEWLVRLGLQDAVKDLVSRGVKNAALIKWEADRPRDFLRCTQKEVMSITGDKTIHRPVDVLKLYIRQKDKPVKMTLESAAFFTGAFYDERRQGQMLKLLVQHGVHAERMMRYLQQAGAVATEEKGRPVSDSETASLYMDYLDAARNCGMDLENPVIFMPRDLIEKHDRVTAAWAAVLQARRDAERQKQEAEARGRREKALACYRKRCKELTDKYLYWTEEFLIRDPVSIDEITAEGKKLKHCVGGYADRHLSGATTILFLRRRDKPGVPLATIEMSGNSIMQVHGYRNELEKCDENPKQMPARQLYAGILDQWLEWLKAGSKREKDGRPKLPKKKNRRNAA